MTERVQCVDCANFSGRDGVGKLLHVAHVGLGTCPHEPGAGRYVAALYHRECPNFAKSEDGPKRRKWLDAQGKVRR